MAAATRVPTESGGVGRGTKETSTQSNGACVVGTPCSPIAGATTAHICAVVGTLCGFFLCGAFCWFVVFSVLVQLGFDTVFAPYGGWGPGMPVSANWEPYGEGTIFDDTWLTWGTDYGIALLCFWLCVLIARCASSPLRKPGAALMLAYAVAALIGALTHQFVSAPESLNSLLFRVAWCGVVGLVALSGGVQLAIARGFLLMHDRAERTEDEKSNSSIPVLPLAVCLGYGSALCLGVCLGFFRTSRPAADIFLLGVSQAPPTFFLLFALFSARQFSPMLRILFVLTLCTMAPTILAYPALVLWGFKPGHINFFMHMLLVVAWGGQGLSLLGFCRVAEGPHAVKKHA